MNTRDIAGLRTLVSGHDALEQSLIILLHGYAMRPEDLAPFGQSLGIPALYLFPQGMEAATPAGHAWWSIDTAARAAARLIAPRDLAAEVPAGLSAARQRLEGFVQACQERFQPRHLIVGGFSQGGMLACDWILHRPSGVDALLLLSASRLNMADWQAHAGALTGLPVLISHGRRDPDLAFSAGEKLHEFVADAGARVTWVPLMEGTRLPCGMAFGAPLSAPVCCVMQYGIFRKSNGW